MDVDSACQEVTVCSAASNCTAFANCRIDGPVSNSLYSTSDRSLTSWTGGESFTPPNVQGGCGRNFAQVPAATSSISTTARASSTSAIKPTRPQIYAVQTNATNNTNDGVNAGAFYAVGAYNLSSNFFLPTIKQPMSIDFGQTFCNEFGSDNPGRGGGARLLWLGNFAARDENHTLTTVVRSITFDHELQLLLSEPVEELKRLRTTDTVLSKTFTGLTGGAEKRQELLNGQQRLRTTHRPGVAKSETVELASTEAFDLELNLTMPGSTNSTFNPVSVGVTVLEFGDAPSAFATGGASVVVSIVSHTQAFMEIGTIHPISRAWVASPLSHNFPIKSGETSLDLRVIVDHLSVEAFAANGRAVASTLLK